MGYCILKRHGKLMTSPSSFSISTYQPYAVEPTVVSTTYYVAGNVSVSKTSSGSVLSINNSGTSTTIRRPGAIVLQEFVAGKIDQFVFNATFNRSPYRTAIKLIDCADDSIVVLGESQSGWDTGHTSRTVSGLLTNASIKKRHKYKIVVEILSGTQGYTYTNTITSVVAS